MGSYEYKVVPAPARGRRGRGISGAEERFANSLEIKINEMAAEGWEYQRAETLPSEERAGLTAAQTVFRYVLVFRRKRSADLSAYDPRVIGEERKPALLLPPVDNGVEPGEASAGDGGLRGLLRRRAATVQSEADTGFEPVAEAMDDLASRFAEDAEDGVTDDTALPPQRPAAE